jgi:hypothetical protein
MRIDPDAAHCRQNLAISVRANSTAGAVTDILRTVHRARHAGIRQDALTAHPAIKEEAFEYALNRGDRALDALVSDK